MSSLSSNPLVTPATRLATRVREVPHIARARLVSVRGSTLMELLSIFTTTSSGSTNATAPFGPFIFTVWPSTLAVTPDGIGTGFLPIRDIAVPSEHRTKDFAADIGVAGGMIRHHALGRRHDGDAQAVVDARQVLHRHVDAPARLRHPLDLADHRLAVEIFELDLELAAAVAVLDGRIIADVAFALEHLEHAAAQLRARRRHLRLGALLGVADAGDHVADRIVEVHRVTSPARLDQAGDHALGAEIPQRDAAHPELAVVPAGAPGHLATVADARRRRIARQLRELELGVESIFQRPRLVIGDRFEPSAFGSKFLRRLAPPVILLDRARLRHLRLLSIRV